jgi:hypothetical protein
MLLELTAIILFLFLRADIQILRNSYRRRSRKKVHFRGKEEFRLYSSGLIDGGGGGGDIPI